MRYSVSGRAQSFLTAGLAVLLALGMHLSAAAHGAAAAKSLRAQASPDQAAWTDAADGARPA